MRRLTVNRKPLRNCLSLAQPCIPRNSPPLDLPLAPRTGSRNSPEWLSVSLFSHCPGVLGRNSAPRKIPLLRSSAPLRQKRSVGFVAEHAEQSRSETFLRFLRHQHNSSFGNWRHCLPSFPR